MFGPISQLNSKLALISIFLKGKKIESSGSKLIPVIIQSEWAFNVGVILDESNYDFWFQLMEMNIVEREKLSYIHGKTKPFDKSDDGYEK